MNKGFSEGKILVIGIIVTVVIVVGLFIKKAGSPMTEPATSEQTETVETIEQAVLEPEQAVEEGLYLEVTSPVEGSVVTSPTLAVSGKTEANAEVFINEKELRADSAGNFSTSLTLEEGDNIIVVYAKDPAGNTVSKEMKVTYEP